ncbi:MAG: alpha/beta fold hydrolase [Pleurocapsa minor GSE-CHR-MK-17-07R]|jgi:carboxylesterase|nr:alpha/beta fold hydrolase [Pleurocapsa minor GSE-CHR-MK 17-07R]
MTVRPIMRGGGTLFWRGGTAIGVLGLHGFTATPSEIGWLGADLHGAGHTVLLPRLFAHGTDPRDMARARWKDWLASACDGLAVLSASCERVIVVGHSMGGMLAMLLAAHAQPQDRLAGAAVLASPIPLPDALLRTTRLGKRLRPYTQQPDTSDLGEVVREEQGRRGDPVVGRVRYDLWSTSALEQLVLLSKAADAALPQVSLPLLLLYSTRDETAPAVFGERIAARAATSDITLRISDYRGHIVTQDRARDAVFAEVREFVTHAAGR